MFVFAGILFYPFPLGESPVSATWPTLTFAMGYIVYTLPSYFCTDFFHS